MQIVPVRLYPQSIPKASLWFSQKWGIAQSEYEQSMRESITTSDITESTQSQDSKKGNVCSRSGASGDLLSTSDTNLLQANCNKIIESITTSDITESKQSQDSKKGNVCSRSGAQDGFTPSGSRKQEQHSCNQINVIPQWYIVLEGENIIAGAGVIDNDFHTRKDLSPNVCALYVEEKYRKMGVARALLEFIRYDMNAYERLYLLTSHKGFYEKCGWKYVCDVETDDKKGGRIYEIGTLG
ncbi:MAG TPA: GNAT family N-acetyltransferase [Candidatus Helicobacter avicola]|nr:GNAT family N-acetyltransferase [Candidatus Helicobacter avicola]